MVAAVAGRIILAALPRLVSHAQKMFKNLKNVKWVAKQAGETAASILVVAPLGKKVYAEFMGYLFDDDEKEIGKVYEDSDGNVYVRYNDGTTVHVKDTEVA